MIVAKYAGVSIELPPFEIGQDNKKEEYTKKFPPGKVLTTKNLGIFKFTIFRYQL